MGRAVGSLREQLVLGQLRPLLDDGEQVVARLHVRRPHDGRRGIIAITPTRCLVRWGARDEPVVIPWAELRAWTAACQDAGGPVLRLESHHEDVAVQLPVSSGARVRRAAHLLDHAAQMAPAHADGLHERSDTWEAVLRVERRSLRAHTRRVVVSVAGVAVILAGLLFASPVVPGPGALTILAGLALLASEYDWASDAHQWLHHQVERIWERQRRWRQRRRQRRRAPAADTVSNESR